MIAFSRPRKAGGSQLEVEVYMNDWLEKFADFRELFEAYRISRSLTAWMASLYGHAGTSVTLGKT